MRKWMRSSISNKLQRSSCLLYLASCALFIIFVSWQTIDSKPKIACMPDNNNMRGERDRDRKVSNEKWEVDYLIDQTGATRQEIAEAIRKVGNNMEKVEEYLRNKRIF